MANGELTGFAIFSHIPYTSIGLGDLNLLTPPSGRRLLVHSLVAWGNDGATNVFLAVNGGNTPMEYIMAAAIPAYETISATPDIVLAVDEPLHISAGKILAGNPTGTVSVSGSYRVI